MKLLRNIITVFFLFFYSSLQAEIIKEIVIKGNKRGRRIGFPTCNLKMGNYVVPRLGVYAVKVKSSDFDKKGIANIGYRPTFNGQSLLLETNIFGINKNLYNKVISVSFKKFIRGEKKFNGVNNLKNQIKIDCRRAKAILSNE